MNDTCLREIIVVVTGKRYPVREVYIFAIHKKCLIEQSAFVESFSAQQHKSPGKYINLIYLVLIKISKMIFGKTTGMRKKA